MSTYYSPMAAESSLKCSEKQFKKINALIEAHKTDTDMGCEFDDGEIYFFGEEYFDVDNLSQEVISAIGKLVKQNGLPYLEFGVAQYCSKLQENSCGGFRFRITAEGKFVQPTITWPESSS